MTDPFTWLYQRFGSRYLVGCKESDLTLFTASTRPVSVDQLAWEKARDYPNVHPFFAGIQMNQVAMVSTWGMMMDERLRVEKPNYVYDTGMMYKDSGAYGSAPLRLGSLVRSFAADVMADNRTQWNPRT